MSFVGLGLVVVALSLFAYRQLFAPRDDRAARWASSSSMWPFVSSLLRSQPRPLHKADACVADASKSHAAPVLYVQQPSESELVPGDPDSTPKAAPAHPPPAIAVVPNFSLDDADEDDAPLFPARDSVQRASGPTSSIASLSTLPAPSRRPAGAMLPPPLPNRLSPAAVARAPAAARSRLAVAGAGASGVAAGSGLVLPNARGNATRSKSRKVILEPGHSPLDWARLQKSGVDLRGLGHSRLIKVSPSLLAQHKTAPADIWMALDGHVYNVTAYIPFHPGGERELLRAAGKDGSKLFASTHPWVNVEGMLSECLIGILVSEEEASIVGESDLELAD